MGDWVLVKFPQKETGTIKELSRPWCGPYHILALKELDITTIKVYFPEDKTICVHLSRNYIDKADREPAVMDPPSSRTKKCYSLRVAAPDRCQVSLEVELI